MVQGEAWASLVAQTVKNLQCRRPSSIPGWGRSLGEGNGNPLQHSCLEKSMGREAWQATVHGVAESDRTEWLTLPLQLHKVRPRFPGCSGAKDPGTFFVVVFSCILKFFFLIFISWRLITLQYCSGFCHTLTWISHGSTYVLHPDPSSHLPLHPIPLGLPSAPALSTCLMHPTWAGDLFHPW